MAEGTRMLQRRATAAVWNVSAYVLAAGELGVTTDTGIIKIGNGTNIWSDLDPAMDSQYLPLLGKAADSELLDGISSENFVKTADATTAATANKVALRTGAGILKSVAGVSTDDVVNFDQMVAADLASRKFLQIRNLTAAFTFAATDVNGVVFAGNSTRVSTYNATVPPNSSIAFPIGSWIDIYSYDIGTVKVVAGAGVSIQGDGRVYGQFGTIRILKTDTDTWAVVRRIDPVDAYARCFAYMDTNTSTLTLDWKNCPLNNELYDTHNGHITGAIGTANTYKYTCQPGQAGTYRVSGMASITAPSSARIHSRILKNDAIFAGSGGAGADLAVDDQSLTGEKQIVLAEGDTVGLQGYCTVNNWYFNAGAAGGNYITSWMNVQRIT